MVLAPVRVLAVDALDIRPQDLHGADRVAHVVQQHVGGVEVHAHVVALQVVEGAAHIAPQSRDVPFNRHQRFIDEA